jgi:hypothetical protein
MQDASSTDLVVFIESLQCVGAVLTAWALSTHWIYTAACAALASCMIYIVWAKPCASKWAKIGALYLIVTVPAMVVYREWGVLQFTGVVAVVGAALFAYEGHYSIVRCLLHVLVGGWFFALSLVAESNCPYKCTAREVSFIEE